MLFGFVVALFISLFFYVTTQKILVAVCCIDERVEELRNCMEHLEKTDIFKKNIIGVFRKKDVLCKQIMQSPDKYIEVSDYGISTGARHNIHGIADKRTKALEYARNNDYDKLIFIDSDIQVEWYTILCLLFGTMVADVSCVAYPMRWASMLPVAGFDTLPHIQIIRRGIVPFQTCAVAGMGCNCIDLRSNKIPEKFTYGEIMGITGEDVGFFLEANRLGASVVVSKWHIVSHKY
jgi:hypothetical protein